VDSVPAASVKKLAKLLKKTAHAVAAKEPGVAAKPKKLQQKPADANSSNKPQGKRGRPSKNDESASQEPAKKRGRPRTKGVVDVPKTHQLLQSTKGDVDFTDRQFLCREMAGVGNFYGVVVRFEAPYYKVVIIYLINAL
jgi:hypothetical protein